MEAAVAERIFALDELREGGSMSWKAPEETRCTPLVRFTSWSVQKASATLRFSERGDSYVPLSPGDHPIRKALAESQRQLIELIEHPQRKIRLAALAPAACVEPTREVVTRVRRILRIEEDPRSSCRFGAAVAGGAKSSLAGLIRQAVSDVNSAVDQRDFLHDLAADATTADLLLCLRHQDM
jgi:hypothetical protein